MKLEDVKTPFDHVVYQIENKHCNEHVAEVCECSVETVKRVRDYLIRRELNARSQEVLQLGMFVYHKDVYNGREQMKIVGLRENAVELEGDYSGGVMSTTDSNWESRSGILLKRNDNEN